MALTFTVTKIDKNFHCPYKNKRECYNQVFDYLTGEKPQTKVCALFGLRRTGKSVVMNQCADNLSDTMKEKTLLIDCTAKTDIYELLEFVQNSIKEGHKYFFIDEITACEDFQKVGELLSNVFVSKNDARIVLSGTDSLGLALTSRSNMFDRIFFVPTTHVPFAEYASITGNTDIDNYIKFGSTLRTDTFINRENMMGYVETAVVNNIILSLQKSEGIWQYPSALTELYEKDLLVDGIQRIINTYSQDIAYTALVRPFKSPVLGSAVNLIATNPEDPDLSIRRLINKQALTKNLSERLGIVPNSPNKLLANEKHFAALTKFLEDIDVFVSIPVLDSFVDSDVEIVPGYIKAISHPGMFHANLQYLFDELRIDKNWLPEASAEKRNKLIDKATDWAHGIIMENCIVTDIYYLLCGGKPVKKDDTFGIDTGRWYVSKLHCQLGSDKKRDYEADIVIFDKETKDTYLFEIKHSSEYVEKQSQHLESDVFLQYIENNFGPVKGRAVLYNGETISYSTVPRISAKDFLLQIYQDAKSKDFTPLKTLEMLSPENVGEYSSDFSCKNVKDMIDEAEQRVEQQVSDNINTRCNDINRECDL